MYSGGVVINNNNAQEHNIIYGRIKTRIGRILYNNNNNIVGILAWMIIFGLGNEKVLRRWLYGGRRMGSQSLLPLWVHRDLP